MSRRESRSSGSAAGGEVDGAAGCRRHMGTIATGTDAIREVLEHVAAMPGFDLHWSAVEVDVSAAGDLGYTRGTYEMTVDDPSGNPTTEKGKYVTVWKKDGAGQRMVVTDIFNADAPPPAEVG